MRITGPRRRALERELDTGACASGPGMPRGAPGGAVTRLPGAPRMC